MPSLNSTTLSVSLTDAAKAPVLASTTSIAVGDLLVIDREALAVLGLSPLRVLRGAAGTAAVSHAAGATVYTGAPSRFQSVDPFGIPPPDVVTPWINLRTGDVWIAQGATVGPGVNARTWQLQVITRSIGALGVPVVTTTP